MMTARDELRALMASWEWAFAHASTCSWGTDPRLEWVLERERVLRERVAAEGDE